MGEQGNVPTSRDEGTLAGSVKPYHRHAFACTGSRDWPGRLEEAKGLLGRMARDVHSRRDGPPPIPKLTATDEPSRGSGLDLLVFPDAVRYVGVDEASWPSVFEDLTSHGGMGGEPLPGRWVFVCVHAARDERCGRCGPPVLEAVRRGCADEGLDNVTVRATSHVGGHKYAGNLLVYPEGIWYGTVTPEVVPRILREHLRNGGLVDDLCRGSMMSS
jgi:(2Fe-2S) ferredoxin